MRKSAFVGRAPTHTPRKHLHDQSGTASLATQLIQLMSAAATVVTALAAYIACASVMNIPTVSILSAACLVAGWLARSRPWRHPAQQPQLPPEAPDDLPEPDDRLLRRLRSRKDR
ncbi:hypothetical protein NDR87_00595 [Nocardia sp. CDC159]|uniref:Uncharacterized protein n=1 Tax=Nocardia pulmonis TaxID=2951408 RepID=A0A9X2E2K8_9NOCA|nr:MULTISPECIES: hypothetical protein [Nocardia]MCM6772490.1 hypothetical protein [Nocardia pulmonis]MCM6784852.1 hypothetical protein [Nocardia sp. CDC159]